MGGVHPHLRTCAPLFHKCFVCYYSVTAGPIVLKFGVQQCMQLSRVGYLCTCVPTCTPRFCISRTAWPIVFKFGVWVGGHYRSAFRKSWVGCRVVTCDAIKSSCSRSGSSSSNHIWRECAGPAWVENCRNARGCFSAGGRLVQTGTIDCSRFTQI